MGAPPTDLCLALLTRLGHRLPGIPNPEEAALEVARALAPLGVAVAVTAVEGDIAIVVAVNAPEGVAQWVSAPAAQHLVGLRMPLDGIESLRVPVRLRRPYYGAGGASDTLRRLTRDPALARQLPNASDEGSVLTVPVMARDHVVALITAWGAGCSAELAPTVEACAAMLSAAWMAEPDPAVERFFGDSGPTPSGEVRTAIESLLRDDAIAAAVQPIVRLYDGSVVGYEALARFPRRGYLVTPDDLFGAAAALHMESSVDMACIRAALREAPRLGDADLFVNVLIGTLRPRGGIAALVRAVHDAGVDPQSVVLEFSEREPVPDLARLQQIAAELRAHGFRIAVDDAGAGHASMRVIAELRPEFIKVDRSLIHTVDSDRARRALVVALLSFGGHIGARLIAEGIESQRDQDALLALGVQFGQGWHLGRPVLTAPMDNQEGTEIADAAWFARRSVLGTRIAPVGPSTPGGAEAAEPLEKASAGSGTGRRGLAHALSDVAHALQSEHDPLRILAVMGDLLQRVVPVKEMCIFVAEYDTHRLVPVIATGPDQAELMADSFSLDAGLTGWAFAQGTAQNIPNTSLHPLSRQVPGTSVIDESMLLVPLVAGEHKLGIINCWRPGVNRFTERELEAASLFAHIAAAAWRNAQLYAELLTAAMSDPLTRLHNSRWLHDVGERDLTRAAREGKMVAVLLVDLDHFKRVNDRSGHAAGDLALQRVATRLRSTVRGADAVVRLGGEEFVAVLYDCGMDGAMLVGEAMRVAVRDITMPHGGIAQLTASIGIAVYPEHGADLEHLLAAADRAMYSAKHDGRDRVERAGDAASPSVIVPLPEDRRSGTARRLIANTKKLGSR